MQHVKVSELPEISEDLSHLVGLIDEALVPLRRKRKPAREPLSNRILSRIIEKEEARGGSHEKDEEEEGEAPGMHLRLKRQMIEYYYKGSPQDSTDSDSTAG